jgi:hypothetical protein
MASSSSLRQAMILKDTCTQVMIKYTPKVPPESFLYRGNAYMALGLPYFALVDYDFAAGAMPLSGRHQVNAKKAIGMLPRQLVGAFPAADDHLSQLINVNLSPNVEVKRLPVVAGSTLEYTRGLYVRSDAVVLAGDTVITKHRPVSTYSFGENNCSYCGKALGIRTFNCQNDKCHEEYCSRECRSHSQGMYHGVLCSKDSVRGMELDTYTNWKDCNTVEKKLDHAAMLLLYRMLGLSIASASVPSTLREIRTLPGFYRFCPQEFEHDMMQRYLKFVKATSTLNSISCEEFVGAYARIHTNLCFRNGAAVLDIATSVVRRCSDIGDNVDANAKIGEQNVVVATKDLKGGEEIILDDDEVVFSPPTQ